MNARSVRQVFTEHLSMSPGVEVTVVLCPFHHDVGTPSLSVDLTKGVFFCHGGCDEPKGGGAIDFLIKWAKKEGRVLTRQQARRQLARGMTLPNAKELARQMVRDELLIFRRAFLATAAEMLHLIESGDYAKSIHSREPTDLEWDTLATIYLDLHSWFQWAYDVLLEPGRDVSPSLILVYKEAVGRGLWNRETYIDVRRRWDARAAFYRSPAGRDLTAMRLEGLHWAVEQATTRYPRRDVECHPAQPDGVEPARTVTPSLCQRHPRTPVPLRS